MARYNGGMPTPSRTNRRVAIVIEASNAYARGLLTGILRHVREHEPWTVFLPEHGRGAPPLEALATWVGDGVIARIETASTAKAIEKLRRKLGIPVIDVSAARLVADLPYVETDDAAIAQAAADHFVERDFRHFAFLGDSRFQWSDNRCRAFVAAVRQIRDHACDGIKVTDVVRSLATTRRALENRFTKRVGHTPHEEISRVQFRRVEQLLRDTELSLAAIAMRTGFKHTEYMTVAFTKRHGMPPSRWRKQRR